MVLSRENPLSFVLSTFSDVAANIHPEPLSRVTKNQVKVLDQRQERSVKIQESAVNSLYPYLLLLYTRIFVIKASTSS